MWARWRLYAPRSSEEVLPRFSSEDFQQDIIGEPVLDTVLRPGDLLYMPRGNIILTQINRQSRPCMRIDLLMAPIANLNACGAHR